MYAQYRLRFFPEYMQSQHAEIQNLGKAQAQSAGRLFYLLTCLEVARWTTDPMPGLPSRRSSG